MPERIGIIGLGAIGGSLALAWREHAPVVAWARDAADREAATAAGVTVSPDDGAGWRSSLARSTVVVLAVPVNEIAVVARDLLALVPDECLVLHVAGLQGQDALGLNVAELGRVLGTHPVAGSERAGFGAAHPAMFRGATVRAEARATDVQRARIDRLWRAAGVARVVWEDALAHDALMSWVSHLPQLTATALAATLAQRAIDANDLGPGARDSTRLAASDLTMWMPLLQVAPRASIDALRDLTSVLDALRDALERRDARALALIWERARAWKATAEKPS